MTSQRFSLIARRTAVVAGALISATACSDEPNAPRRAAVVPPGISAVDNPDLAVGTTVGRGITLPPFVDGKIGKGEYTSAAAFVFTATLPGTILGPGSTPVTVSVTHDATYLYLAATYDRKSLTHPNDFVSFEFDNDHDGITENGDDIVLSGAWGAQNVSHPGADFYRFNGGAANQSDAAGGGTIETLSAWGTVGTTVVFETRQPLNSSDNAHDISIDPTWAPVTVGMRTGLTLEANPIGSSVFVHSYKPSQTTYCKLTIGKNTTSVSCP
jgi:hypothetical protein